MAMLRRVFSSVVLILVAGCCVGSAAEAVKPLRVLLITGGCCHNYAFQTAALKALSAICDMEVGELQSAVQSSLETELLDMYDQHKDKQQLH